MARRALVNSLQSTPLEAGHKERRETGGEATKRRLRSRAACRVGVSSAQGKNPPLTALLSEEQRSGRPVLACPASPPGPSNQQSGAGRGAARRGGSAGGDCRSGACSKSAPFAGRGRGPQGEWSWSCPGSADSSRLAPAGPSLAGPSGGQLVVCRAHLAQWSWSGSRSSVADLLEVWLPCRVGGSGPYAGTLSSWPTRCRPAISAYGRRAGASTGSTNESQVTARCSQAASECPPSSGVPSAEPGVTWKHPSARSRSSQSGQLSRSSSPRRRMSARSPMSSRRPQ